MTKITQTPENVVSFPIQRRETDNFSSIAEDILQARLVLTEGLNKLAAGQIVLSDIEKERWRQSFNETNAVFLKHGYPPIYFNI